MSELARLREAERWIAWVRLAAVPFAIVEVSLLTSHYPSGYEAWAWGTTAVLTVGALSVFVLCRTEAFLRAPRLYGFLALLLDVAVVSAYVVIYQFEIGSPTRQLLYVVVVEAAVRYGIRGGALAPLALVSILAFAEWWRESRFDTPPHGFQIDNVVFPWGVMTITGVIAGWLVDRLGRETSRSQEQVAEAERLRDELGRRADVLDAATRASEVADSWRSLSTSQPTIIPVSVSRPHGKATWSTW